LLVRELSKHDDVLAQRMFVEEDVCEREMFGRGRCSGENDVRCEMRCEVRESFESW
jgi:hypothetical protein